MISDRALDKIIKAPTSVDSCAATMDALAEDQTISPETAGIVKLALAQSRGRLESAINARPSPVAPTAAPRTAVPSAPSAPRPVTGTAKPVA